MKAVTLFSGCGGLDLGLRQAGFEICYAIDADQTCTISYNRNFGGDTCRLTGVEELTASALRTDLGDNLGNIDLLAGGPPCPPFSKSRFYRKEKPRALKDEVGGTTLRGYLNVLRIVRPKAFLLENVPGLAYSVHEEALQLLLREAKKAGYTCAWQILNAADYGVPQMRERFFLVGFRSGRVFDFPERTHAQPGNEGLFSASLPPWKTAGEALNDLDVDHNDDSGHRAGGQHAELLKQVPPGDNYLYFTKERGYPNPIFRWRSRYWSFLLKLSPSLPSWTIQARRSNNMGPFHWRNRILRIAEVKRLQGFPDDWHLEGNVERQWRQIGNAVPPPLAKALGAAIIQQLKSDNDSEKQPSEHERVLHRRGRGTPPSSRNRGRQRRQQSSRH